MCGICGIIGNNKEKATVIRDMMNSIIHRGPDSDGTYVDEHAALGFRRLSIIDLDHGSQPMYNETRDLVIVFNGEIYNHHELRQELKAKGHVFANQADTECLVHGYEEWGEEMLSHLRGMFAFAIWDTKKQKLFAARDFFGIKPFYYGMINEKLVFCSEIKGILKDPDYVKEFNEDALGQYLSFQYSVLPETFFKGIYRLPPAHYMTYENGKLEIKRYWDALFDPKKKQSMEDAKEDIARAMKDSIRAHKISDVEVGSLLSGGVDSNYVVATADVDKTFTVGFSEDNGRYSEIGLAKAMSEEVGCENYQKVITPEEYWDVLKTFCYYMDEPVADPSAVALYFVDQLAADHLKVVLSGEGSDEFFGGYTIYCEPDSLRLFNYVPSSVKKVLRKKFLGMKKRFKGRNFMIRGCTPLEQRFIGNAYLFHMDEKEKVLADGLKIGDPSELTKPYYEKTKNLDGTARMQYIDINFWLPGDILMKADKMSMAHSLESRVPFLDKEVFSVARRLSHENRVHGSETKRAFRQVALDAIPEEAAKRKKLGFPTPTRVWLREEKYYKIVKAMFQTPEAGKFFNQKELMRLLNQHYNGQKDNSRKIWCIYIFLVWYQVYFLEEPENYAIAVNAKKRS